MANSATEARVPPAESGDWPEIAERLDRDGFAIVPGVLDASACTRLIATYECDSAFRARIVMSRHGFGRGEYQYFTDPLPAAVAGLRESFYRRLSPIANAWGAALGGDTEFPPTLAEFRGRCHAAGQKRPTPLILKYQSGDYNRLHQDLYGTIAFPIQLAVLLSRPHVEFTGGEFVLTEQSPRMQSRAHVAPLDRGDGILFAVNARPVHGARGVYRVRMRHGVSTVHSGTRFTLGVIFHDAT